MCCLGRRGDQTLRVWLSRSSRRPLLVFLSSLNVKSFFGLICPHQMRVHRRYLRECKHPQTGAAFVPSDKNNKIVKGWFLTHLNGGLADL